MAEKKRKGLLFDEVLPQARRTAQSLLSLDPQEDVPASQQALEMALGFVPGIGQAMALRDIERARRAQDPTAGALAAASLVPFGRLLGKGRSAGPIMSELDVYHGTPHRFPATEANPLGEFDASKIGTGEGAQAYGHGIYYAENPDVAKGYQSTLRQTNAWEIDGQRVHGVRSRSDAQPINYAANALERFDGDKKAAIAWLKDSKSPWDLEAAQLLAKSKTAQKAPGSLYKADLPDEMIDRMLDYDKPLKEQPANVQKFFNRIYKPDDYLTDWLKQGDPDSVAQILQQEGIPGIKYLDAGSRGQGGSGTRNFVVFPGEEKKVKILERK